jgi:phage-related protein
MPTVAELGVHIDADDDATKKILAIDALIKGLDSDDVDIDIDANAHDVEAEIKKLMADLDRLDAKSPDIDIDLDTGGAAEEIEILKAELKSIGDERVKIKVDSDEVHKGRASMDGFRNSALQASRSVNGIAAAVLGLGTALIPIGGVAVGGIAALTTALSVAGIGTALYGAVAVTVFGNVKGALKGLATAQEAYNTAITDDAKDKALAKMKAIMDSLSPAEREMVKGIQAFQAAWRSFAGEFQPIIFQTAAEGLKGIAGLLPSLAPIVQAAAGAFLFLERAALRALAGPFWQSFIKMIGSNLGPLLRDLGRSIGNVFSGIAALFMAFMPLTRDFTGGMVDMTQAFEDWAKGLAESQGFKNFVNYIRENTPLVLNLIGQIVLAFVAIIRAGAPLGEALVKIASGMFHAMEAFQKAHPLLALLGLGFIGVAAVGLKVLGPILAIANVFSVVAAAALAAGVGVVEFLTGLAITAGIVLAVVAAVAALAFGIYYAYTHFQAFHDIVNAVGSAIAAFAVTVYNAIVGGLGAAAAWLSTTFGPMVSTVIGFIVQQFNKIVEWATTNAPVFLAAWQTILGFLTFVMTSIVSEITGALAIIVAIWTVIWPTLSAILSAAWTVIKGVVSGALDIIMGVILFWAALLSGNWGAAWNGILQILKGVWEIMKGVVVGAFQFLAATWKASLSLLFVAWDAFWAGIKGGLSAAWGTIESIFSAAWGWVKAGFSAFQGAVQATVNAMWAGIIAIFRGAWNLLVAGLSSAFNTMKSGVSSAMSAISGVISTGWSNIKGNVSAALSTLVGLIWGLGGQFFTAGASIMHSLASGISSAIGDAVGAVKGAIGSITDLLPGSPAKVGPLSGDGYAMIRGQHLAEDLAAGIAGRAGLVASAARDIADVMSLGLDSGPSFAGIASTANPGQGGGSTTVTLAPGSVVVQVGNGVSPAEARLAFDGASGQLANDLLTAIRRQ